MTHLPVSVVVVSRDRPEALKRCLLGLSQVQYTPMEVVVVADPQGIAAAEASALAGQIKTVPFDVPNISAARNGGINAAAGEVVAFIDDDAVPEPTWLHYLCLPFSQSDVAATGGFVRGRNGISYQWKARMLDASGAAHAFAVDEDKATILHPPAGQAVKTEGTNMAVRRDVLVDLGGFDPNYHFFLDETDLNMRLAAAGYATAICPRAQVHHGFAASASRRTDRAPRDLFDIGASWSVFLNKHVRVAEHARIRQQITEDQRKRVLSHMVSGRLEPRDVRRLMARLREGFTAGNARAPLPVQLTTHAAEAFRQIAFRRRQAEFLAARPLTSRSCLRVATDRVKNGSIVTVINMSATAMFHHVQFTSDGVWLQKGGLFGKSDRGQPLFRLWRRSRRHAQEVQRVAQYRGKNGA